MTVSANANMEFTRDQLVTVAYRLAGLVEHGKQPSGYDLEAAADYANMELQALQAEGEILRSIVRTTLTLVSGTAAYTLDADTIDVKIGPNDQAGTIVPTSGSETLVTTMSRAEYMDLADKTANTTARPTRVLIEKFATVSATFWPVPDSTSASFKYARVRLLKDLDSGDVTVDLPRRWLKYMSYAIATHIARAKSMPTDNVMDLQSVAENAKAMALGDDNERGKVRFRLAHTGRHW